MPGWVNFQPATRVSFPPAATQLSDFALVKFYGRSNSYFVSTGSQFDEEPSFGSFLRLWGWRRVH
jgi:hypothetical protein